MSRNIPDDSALEKTLARIELPGENPVILRRYLEESMFVERVMDQVRFEASRSQKTTAWALFALINLIFLVVFGSSRYIVENYFAMQETLSQFFFLFLGISFLGALFGLVMSADTSWVETLPQSLQPLLKMRRHTVRNGLPK
jgi:hypothetical protein